MNVTRWLLLCILFFAVAFQPVAIAQSSPSACIPGISGNPIVMENLCNDPPPAKVVPAVAHSSAPVPMLTLSAERLSHIRLDDPPTIAPGDVMVFEANRRDFVLRTQLSNGKEIIVGPLTVDEAEDTSVAWRKGHVRLDYPEALGQKIMKYSVKVLHETRTPLLFRGVKIYRAGTMMLELEPASPAPKRNPAPHFEPPSRYPSDPVLVASLHQPPLSLHRPGSASTTGFVRTILPPMQPLLAQSTTTTTATDPDHFKWNGKEFDAESGLLNFGARYYSPALGRFMTPDPKIMSAQRMFDPQQWNMYSYGRNNPTTFIDPDGKELQYANAADKKALHNVLVNIARRPGGLSMLKTLSDSKAIFTLHKTEKGELGGTGYYGLTAPAGQVTYDHATGKDLQGTIEIKVDLDQRKADQDMAQAGVLDPKKVPPSDEQTMGHELTHGERIAENPKQYLATPEAERERDADENANNVLKEKPGDKKEAEKQLDHLIKDPKDPKR